MKLLIIEDNGPLAELTALLLRWVDSQAHWFETITVAGDLESALARLPEHDAVLSDGRLPLAPGSPFVVEEWDVLHREAARRSMHFVLYTSSARALAHAREIGVPALDKPALLEEIYDALTGEPEAHRVGKHDRELAARDTPSQHTGAGGSRHGTRETIQGNMEPTNLQAELGTRDWNPEC